MPRRDPLNERQLDVLRRIGTGDDLSRPEDAGLRISGRALQSRGLVKISRRGGGWQAVITAAGEFYLKHGHHPGQRGPGQPATAQPQEGAPARRAVTAPPGSGGHDTSGRHQGVPGRSLAQTRHAAAAALIRRLESEKCVTIKDPAEDTVTEWRRTIDFVKRHSLVPPGRWIEKRRDWLGNLTIELMSGDPPNKRLRPGSEHPAVPVPSQLRSLHPVIARLRDDAGRLVMPASRRRRCLLILQALAAEAERRGHTVIDEPVPEHRRNPAYTYMGRHHPSSYSRREGEIRIRIGEFSYAVTIAEESPQSADLERSDRLIIEVTPYRSQGRQCRWADRKTWKVEDRLATLLQELETRAVEDAQHKIEQKKAEADRRRRWEQAMAEAQRKAYEEQDAAELRDQIRRWREAQEIDSYCQALADRLKDEPADRPGIRRAQDWLSWARARATALDPLRTLPAAPERPELTPEDLKPYLQGWSPYGPEEHRRW